MAVLPGMGNQFKKISKLNHVNTWVNKVMKNSQQKLKSNIKFKHAEVRSQ